MQKEPRQEQAEAPPHDPAEAPGQVAVDSSPAASPASEAAVDSSPAASPASAASAGPSSAGLSARRAVVAEPRHDSGAKAGLGILDILYGVFAQPTATFDALVQSPRPGPVLLLVALNSLLASVVLVRQSGPLADVLQRASWFWLWVATLATSILFTAILAGLVQLVGELLGGRGRMVDLLQLMLLSGLPGLFNLPAVAITQAASFNLATPAQIAIGFWGIWLMGVAVRSALGVSTTRGLGAVLIVLFGFILALIAIIVTFALLFAGALQDLPGFPGLPGGG